MRPDFRLWRPSGGLAWHWRAWCGAQRHRPFRLAVESWLAGWSPPCARLILVGPSAGWTLPGAWLSQFQEILAIDLDPLAPWFFALNHPVRRTGLRWLRGDLMTELPRHLQAWPDAAVLFCNVLGQLAVEREDHELVLAELPRILRRHHWASFHDCYTGDVSRQEFESLVPFSLQRRMSADDPQRLGVGGEWLDHGAGQLLTAQHS